MYYIVELQTLADGQAANLVYTAEEKNQALSKYHEILHYAAISGLPCHAAVVLENDGRQIAREAFVNNVPESEQ